MSCDAKVNEIKLKERIKELELEVSSLKRRLDELRKAKNTTILKREREVLEVGAPFGRRTSQHDLRATELERKLKEAEKEKDKELDSLRSQFQQQMQQVKNDFKSCDHGQELAFLRQRNEVLENENLSLSADTKELGARVEALVTDLSVKEARWCQAEEQLKLKLKQSWSEQYKEWMETTQAKISELEKANQFLQNYVKKFKPSGKDPTGQDDPDAAV